MTYAVAISEDDGPGRVGRLELEPSCLRFAGGEPVRYADLRDVYVERRSGGSISSSPTLVVVTRGGGRLQIASLEGLGALHELAEELVEARGKTEI